eukprot:m.36348 g.36348  ORF g.36348 m.36348 type:complete len:307 (-) comp7562_c0_seq2:1356-2276(-)
MWPRCLAGLRGTPLSGILRAGPATPLGRSAHLQLGSRTEHTHEPPTAGRHELRAEHHSRVLDAFIPPGAHIVTKPGALVGSTKEVDKTSTLHGGMLGAIRRKIRGGNLFLDLVRVQGRNPGSAVLAPEDGLVTAMSVIPGGMSVRADAFLACTSGITISSRGRSGVVDADALQLGGTGTVAVCSYGQGVTLELESGAQYLVLQRHHLAWDNSVTAQLVDDPDSAANRLLPRLRSKGRHAVRRILGQEDWVRLTGPGKLCFAISEKPTLNDVRKAVHNTIVLRTSQTAESVENVGPPTKRVPKPPRL